MTYKNVTYPVHRYRGDYGVAEIDAEVFGSGFVHLKRFVEKDEKIHVTTILVDPSDIENLEVALKEAKRRRNASARRRARKLAREGLSVST